MPKIGFFILVLISISNLSNVAQAAAFYIQEQSISGLGTAFAGAVADTPDASTIYYNPAGMTELGQAQISIGSHLIIPSADFSDRGTSASVGTIIGGDGGDPYEPALVPNAYFAYPLSDDSRWWGGIGISAPFGLENEYDNDFVGRYNSTENALKTINVAPSLAWAATNWLSVGFGLDVQYVDAKLENALADPTVGAGNQSVATDGLQDLSGDDTTIGFNAGLLFKPADGTKIGLHYRQGISHTLEGRLITVLPAGLGGTVSRLDGSSAELDLPGIASVGIAQQVSDKLQLLGHVTWFEWSNFDDIPVSTPSGFTTTTQGYENTFAIAIGARYQLDQDWLLKIGMQYDQTPTVTEHRSTRIPDGDRIWLAGGATYSLSDKFDIDFSAAYVDVEESTIDLTETQATGVTVTTRGQTEGSVGILSAALRYKF